MGGASPPPTFNYWGLAGATCRASSPGIPKRGRNGELSHQSPASSVSVPSSAESTSGPDGPPDRVIGGHHQQQLLQQLELEAPRLVAAAVRRR